MKPTVCMPASSHVRHAAGSLKGVSHLGHTALGSWSGGRFMHFGEPVDEERLVALLRPDARIRTVVTADVYGCGEADALLGRALEGVPREEVGIVGAVGHDFY